MTAPHPIQPLELDDRGVLRFKRNALVDYCVKQVGLNNLCAMEFSAEDWSQMAQLIGYSHSGAPSYLDDTAWHAALAMHDAGMTEDKARIAALEQQLEEAQDRISKASALLAGEKE